ncbi:MAG: shikimate dehydrogenase [Treponema sp.]|nr:shikimate dehydrogenase [Treponema sp.]
MTQPLICMCLTGKTLEEDFQLAKKYEKYVDVVELRVDHLSEEEQLYVKRFPSMIYKPCILTIRRTDDGGLFSGSEFSRTNLFARALAFAEPDKSKNFAFVDFEEDYHVPSMHDAAMAFGVRIIRSCHSMNAPVHNIRQRCDEMRKTAGEIPKIAFMPDSLADVETLFRETQDFTDYDHIICAMGAEGLPSRILAGCTNSFLTYTSPQETLGKMNGIGHIDPISLRDLYGFKSISESTKIFGITGWPLSKTSSPEIHNGGYKKLGIDAVYVPLRATSISNAVNFADAVGIQGMSVTIPHKETVIHYLDEQSEEVVRIEACNTIVKEDGKWIGYNTDVGGFRRALDEFLCGTKIKFKKVAVIGAGGAAKAIVHALKQMGARVCIFNRTVEHAQRLAEKYGFSYCQLDARSASKIDEYSTLIVQTTSVGMNSDAPSSKENDPLYFYEFRGNEMVFDIIYTPSVTPIMRRAAAAGCRTCNGYKMLEYQAYEQFALFTGRDMEQTNPDE